MNIIGFGGEFMKSVVKSFDSLPRIVKVIFALPVLDIIWAIYRVCRSIEKKNVLAIILSILMLFICPALFWIVDLITTIVSNKVLWIC